MANYYKYDFVSPEPVFATVKEELKSYFDTGAVDDLMFPTYLNKCLDKLGKGSYTIVEEIFYVEDYQFRLPDNFEAVREAWLCTSIGNTYRSANSFYSQATSEDTIQVSPVISGGQPCTNLDCDHSSCGDAACMPELIQAVYKTNTQTPIYYTRQYLLKPGNISVKAHCSLDCKNFGSSAPDSFDIRDNKFVTNFKTGTVYLVFYATEYDKESYQLIPDNYRIKEYLELYLKYKVFETLTNQVTDESFNQLKYKMDYYKALSDEAYIIAKNEIQKQTAYQKQNRIKENLNRLNMYELPQGRRGLWGRNGYRYKNNL
jgi:hypothetical protein